MAEKNEEGYAVVGPFRLAFPQVFEAKSSVAGGKEKFSITMLFPKSGESPVPSEPYTVKTGLVALRLLALDTVKAKWGEDKAKWPANLKGLDFKTAVSATGKDGWPIRDGDLVTWDGFAGQIFVRASSQYAPGVVDKNVQKILNKQDFFGGLLCRAQITCFTYDNQGNKGVSFGVNNVQVMKDDGTVFGGKQDPSKVFESFGSDSPAPADDEAAWN